VSRLDRARLLLARPGAWLDADRRGYPVRMGGDRRCRVSLILDEADFRALIERPGLTPRPCGGWTARGERAATKAPPAGRPGVVEGERTLMGDDGLPTTRRANLAQSALTWLATRRDPQGRPWLDPSQRAAGERLALEAEAGLSGPSLTMRWDALPRSGGGSAARVEPGDRALAAGRRVEAALRACGPWRPMIEAVCVRGSALQAAEQSLGLRRRTGRAALKAGLTALAAHYRIG
jgi:hypothetical protein